MGTAIRGRRNYRQALTSCLAVALALQALSAQVPGIAPPPPPPPRSNQSRPGRPTFSMTMSQVVVNVSITDRSGKPVEHLTKDDFEIYEDGKPQIIRACEFQRLGTTPLAPLNPATQF